MSLSLCKQRHHCRDLHLDPIVTKALRKHSEPPRTGGLRVMATWPNLWLGSGVPPLSQFEATGVNVALSVDGPWLEQRGRTWLEVTRQATTLACLSDSLLIFSRRLLDSKWVA